MKLLTVDAEETFERAERARMARVGEGRTFRGVQAALAWYFETRTRVQAPKNLYPTTAQTYHGQTVAVEMVDGGRGSDIEDVLATLATIADALRDLGAYAPMQHRVVRMRHCDCLSQAEIARRMQASQATISAWLGAAEGFLAGALRHGGVIV